MNLKKFKKYWYKNLAIARVYKVDDFRKKDANLKNIEPVQIKVVKTNKVEKQYFVDWAFGTIQCIDGTVFPVSSLNISTGYFIKDYVKISPELIKDEYHKKFLSYKEVLDLQETFNITLEEMKKENEYFTEESPYSDIIMDTVKLF